jgi:hypothetical protein
VNFRRIGDVAAGISSGLRSDKFARLVVLLISRQLKLWPLHRGSDQKMNRSITHAIEAFESLVRAVVAPISPRDNS